MKPALRRVRPLESLTAEFFWTVMPHRWSELPRPFYDDWSRRLKASGQALWAWHVDLLEVQPIIQNGMRDAPAEVFEADRQRVLAGEPVRLLREPVWRAAYRACEEHGLPRPLLADQIGGAKELLGSIRFEDASALEQFVRCWAVAHTRLLAGLLDVAHTWQLQHVDELARGFFFVGRLMTLAEDLEQDQLFIPLCDLEQTGVRVEQLRAGDVDESMRRLLWKQLIRARDALGQGRPLIRDLSFRYRFVLKRWWHGALEVLNEIERRDFDVWSEPLDLSLFRRTQVNLQALFGKAAGRT